MPTTTCIRTCTCVYNYHWPTTIHVNTCMCIKTAKIEIGRY